MRERKVWRGRWGRAHRPTVHQELLGEQDVPGDHGLALLALAELAGVAQLHGVVGHVLSVGVRQHA